MFSDICCKCDLKQREAPQWSCEDAYMWYFLKYCNVIIRIKSLNAPNNEEFKTKESCGFNPASLH